ncbi:DUF305 domain-containing protein [Cellulomonas gilvus]|uniref:DUF305 domain-containing protein n=1 Tax=Cellulomonas gilvus TaxID=11 RepID=UPI001FE1768C|nr:DUF305 domain-containing protein [Cellulomonas gilvus]
MIEPATTRLTIEENQVRRRVTVAIIASTTAAGLLLAGCSSTATPADPAATASETVAAPFNDSDVTFAQMMVVHHEGAIEMADLAVERGTNPEVQALGKAISAAQGPEIEQMTSWLESWGEPTADDMMDMDGMDHGGMDMDGMDQAGAMADLDSLSGTEFDRRFLELMTAHHQGAIEMSEQELADGENADALALARRIIDAQNAEIVEMTNMLGGL